MWLFFDWVIYYDSYLAFIWYDFMVKTYIMVLDSYVQFFDMKEWVPVQKTYETYIFLFS